MLNRRLNTFSSGELSPRMRSRVDLVHYQSGADRLQDVVVLPQGGVSRRPGSVIVSDVPGALVDLGGTYTMPSGGNPVLIRDGDPTTTTAVPVAVGPGSVIIHVDLGSLQDVYGMRLRNLVETTFGSATRQWWTERAFRLEWSTDNAAWNPFGGAVNKEFGVPSFVNDTQPGTIADWSYQATINTDGSRTATQARYLRLLFIGTAAYTATNLGLSEAAVLGSNATDSSFKTFPYRSSDGVNGHAYFIDGAVQLRRDGNAAINGQRDTWDYRGEAFVPTGTIDPRNMPFVSAFDTIMTTNRETGIWRVLDLTDTPTGDALVYSYRHTFRRYKLPTPAGTLFDFRRAPLARLDPGAANTGGAGILDPQVASTKPVAGMVANATSTVAEFASTDVGQYLVMDNGLTRGLIIEFVSTTNVIVLWEGSPLFNTYAANAWYVEQGYESIYSNDNGWPDSLAIFQGRLYLGGGALFPEFVFGSRVNDFGDFLELRGLDDEPLSMSLDVSNLDPVIRIETDYRLLAFTETSSHFLPVSEDEPVTPTTAKMTRFADRGVRPGTDIVRASDRLHMIANGRSSIWRVETDGRSYVLTDVSLLIDHLVDEPDSLATVRTAGVFWKADTLVLSRRVAGAHAGDFTMLGVIDSEQFQAGSRGKIANGAVDAVGPQFAATPDGDLFVTVRATFDGVSERYVMVACPDVTLDFAQIEQAANPLRTYWANEEQTIWTGGIVSTATADGSGQLTVAVTTEDRWIGKPFIEAPRVITLPIGTQTGDGLHMLRRTRIARIMADLVDSRIVTLQGQVSPNRGFGPAAGGSPLGAPPVLSTGQFIVGPILGWAQPLQITVSSQQPYEFTLTGLEVRTQIS